MKRLYFGKNDVLLRIKWMFNLNVYSYESN